MNDATVQRPIRWSAASRTHAGMVRKVNEDALLNTTEKHFWAVADGMGGHSAGDVASGMVVNALETLDSSLSLGEIVDAIDDTLVDANSRILEYADIMLEQPTIGSTVVSLLIKGRVGVCIWAGDSRLYRYRNRQLMQLTQDHSQVEELLQQGFIGTDEASHHPEANVITRAVGASDELFTDINVFGTQFGDTFLLCSDGLYNAVDLPAVMHLFDLAEPGDIADALLELALSNGASDNVSLIVIKGMISQVQQPLEIETPLYDYEDD